MPAKQNGKTNNVENIVNEYEVKSQEILRKMMMVLVRAQRKVDDKAYLKVLQNLEKIK